MNKTISIIRISILFILFGIAMIFLFSEEQDESLLAFTFHMLVDKALAIGLFFYGGRLYKRWCKVDPWLKAYDKLCDDVMDNPNPSQL
ncbi:MAG: hypothetical protein K2N13_00885 [Paraprevotella sp.]|nr:hypothetical protein [Paraprevotella sp.]